MFAILLLFSFFLSSAKADDLASVHDAHKASLQDQIKALQDNSRCVNARFSYRLAEVELVHINRLIAQATSASTTPEDAALLPALEHRKREMEATAVKAKADAKAAGDDATLARAKIEVIQAEIARIEAEERISQPPMRDPECPYFPKDAETAAKCREKYERPLPAGYGRQANPSAHSSLPEEFRGCFPTG